MLGDVSGAGSALHTMSARSIAFDNTSMISTGQQSQRTLAQVHCGHHSHLIHFGPIVYTSTACLQISKSKFLFKRDAGSLRVETSDAED